MTVTDHTPAEILEAAADHIAQYGWVQKGYALEYDQLGPCCAVGAVNYVTSGQYDLEVADIEAAVRAVVAEIESRYGAFTDDEAEDALDFPSGMVIAWNDEDGRTAAEVVDVLRAAAKRAVA